MVNLTSISISLLAQFPIKASNGISRCRSEKLPYCKGSQLRIDFEFGLLGAI